MEQGRRRASHSLTKAKSGKVSHQPRAPPGFRESASAQLANRQLPGKRATERRRGARAGSGSKWSRPQQTSHCQLRNCVSIEHKPPDQLTPAHTTVVNRGHSQPETVLFVEYLQRIPAMLSRAARPALRAGAAVSSRYVTFPSSSRAFSSFQLCSSRRRQRRRR